MNTQMSPIKNLWFGFVGAVAIYVFIGYQSLSQKNQTIVFNYSDLFEGLFIGAVILALILVAIAQSFLPKFLQTNDIGRKMMINLLQFALSEVAGIIGIVLFFSRGSFAQLVALSLIAFISLLKLFPQEA